MAQNKKPSQAERAAAASKKKPSVAKKAAPAEAQEQGGIPIRLILAFICLGMFFFNLVMLFNIGFAFDSGSSSNNDGVFLKLLYEIILGLVGKTGFYLSIPTALYLFSVLAFSGRRPVAMRSLCMIVFMLLISCITHLLMNQAVTVKGFKLIGALYNGGAAGRTGGVICGIVSIGLSKLLFRAGAFIVLIVCAAICGLAAFGITIPGLIRAFENRPRGEWEEDEDDPDMQLDPAEAVVNHFATKRIEYIEHRRKQLDERAEIDIPLTGEKKKKSRATKETKPSSMMQQIADIDEPVSTAEPIKERNKVSKQPMEIEDDGEVDILPIAAVHSQPKSEAVPQVSVEPIAVEIPPDPAHDKVTAQEARASAAQVAAEIAQGATVEKPIYCFPPMDLLHPAKRGGADGTAEMKENTRRLNETLASFKIEASIINVTRGPSVTRYEVELEKGVRLSKLTTVADDIALSLGASSVRIAPVPDKISVVGIEVPNRAVTKVLLREVIDSPEFARAKSKSSFAVGKDIGGACIVGNIAKLPHMLIAGTTGSGKSVCMNSIIISLLYKASPDDVKLIMVDPKMVELGIYNGIPHLLIPVVTDPKKAAGSLQWAVTEMMRRYKSMSDAGVRDLESYNSIMESEEGTKLPQIVVIIDELADLMLVAAKEVEESICRIAQMGRAAGIHLIIATQRPSADVITGLMKANIPSRIAFAVASAMESRIILDTQGAEKLVGRGDMLFAPIGNGKPLRVQGCFVEDEEVEAVANYVKENYITHYDQAVMDEIEQKAVQTGSKGNPGEPMPTADESTGDEMLPDAVEVILETGQASVSMLQRRLKLGYARAARIVDEMEEKGIVGPFKGAKPREILITREQWAEMNGNVPLAVDSLNEDSAVPEDF